MASGRWSFEQFPWTEDMHNAEDELCVGQKAAQMGFTELCLNRCFFSIDVEARSVLYVLPTEGDASDFSTSRFDPALELSGHLQGLFSDVKNIGHKRAGGCSLFVRGSKSKSKLKSLPCGQMFFDEVDEMEQSNITLAFERMSGQAQRQAWMISTPTVDGHGINAYFKDSTQEHYFFKCPHCSKMTELIFPECLIITADEPNDKNIMNSYLVCKECGGRLEHVDKPNLYKTAEWVPSDSSKLAKGYYINQLYSCRLEPYKLAQLWLKGQTNPTDEQEFYNSKMGLTHAVEGAQLTKADIDSCISAYKKYDRAPENAFVTMGIDVGTWLHYEIDQYTFSKDGSDINTSTTCHLLTEGKVKSFEEIDELMKRFRVMSCVIDNQPETRKALELANRFNGIVHLCIYGRGISSKNIMQNENLDHRITVNRTSWLDQSLGRFRDGTIKLPVDVSQEFKRHLCAPVRVYKADKDGNPYGMYVNTSDDHAAHARNYSEIALHIGAQAFAPHSISSPI